MRPEEQLFAGHPTPLAVSDRLREVLDGVGPYEVRLTRSQVGFRRRRGFASVWRPGQYLSSPGAEAVVSIVLAREDGSSRWKEVVHPSNRWWMHHLEVHGPEDLDEQVEQWLREAWELAG